MRLRPLLASHPKAISAAVVLLLALPAAGALALAPARPGVDFEFTLLDGTGGRVSDHRGRVVLLDFMATWCVPCQLAMPKLNALRAHFGNDFVLLSVSVDPSDSTADLGAFRATYNGTWPFAILPDPDAVTEAYGIKEIPTYVLLDRSGRMVTAVLGFFDYDRMTAEIQRLL